MRKALLLPHSKLWVDISWGQENSTEFWFWGLGSRERKHFYIGYVLLYILFKVTPNLAAENNKLLLSHSFWRSGTWEQLSCMALAQGLIRLSSVSEGCSHLKAWPDYWFCFQDGWHMQLLTQASVPHWLLAEDLSSLHHLSPHMLPQAVVAGILQKD